jgi:hypothetical protein
MFISPNGVEKCGGAVAGNIRKPQDANSVSMKAEMMKMKTRNSNNYSN